MAPIGETECRVVWAVVWPGCWTVTVMPQDDVPAFEAHYHQVRRDAELLALPAAGQA